MLDFFLNYPQYKWILFFLDIILFNVVLHLALYLGLIDWLGYHVVAITPGLFETVIYVLFSILYFQYSELYKIQNIYKKSKHIVVLLKSLLIITCGIIIFSLLMRNYSIMPISFFAIFYFVGCIVFIVFRVSAVFLIVRFNKKILFLNKVVIIGAGKKGRALLDMFTNKIKVKNVVGFLDDGIKDKEVDGIPVMGKIEDAPLIANSNEIDFFILAIDNIERARFFQILKFFLKNNLSLSVSSEYLKVLYDLVPTDIYGQFGMIHFRANSNEKLFLYIKRAMDIFVSCLAIVLLSPVLIVLAILVKLTSPGTIIYKHVRIGKNGKPFYFYKFRSLLVNSDKDKQRDKSVEDFIKGANMEDSQSTKIVNKKNYTPIGAFIRKYSLDELPQIFNVLKGDMSLVGPRPCILKEWKMYEDWQKLRLKGIPGCTGMWQVYGRSKVDFEQSVLMDVCYNQNYTPWLDLKILIKTIPVMLFGKGGA